MLQLRVEAPPEFAALRTRLESFDWQYFDDIVRLLGLTEPGPAINVVLAREDSDWARRASAWIAGFAIGDLVVIFPSRSPSYPHHTLDDVLRHEVAHVLIRRASGERPIPRWFNEGLAMAAEHGWRFEDQIQLIYQLVLRRRTTLQELEYLFAGNQRDQSRAYALAGAFVQDVLHRHGANVAGEILKRVRQGTPFNVGFADTLGMTPADAESEFWQRQRIWTTWLPIVTSSATIWAAVTLLAILAIRRRRQRNIEIEEKWKEEEGHDAEL